MTQVNKCYGKYFWKFESVILRKLQNISTICLTIFSKACFEISKFLLVVSFQQQVTNIVDNIKICLCGLYCTWTLIQTGNSECFFSLQDQEAELDRLKAELSQLKEEEAKLAEEADSSKQQLEQLAISQGEISSEIYVVGSPSCLPLFHHFNYVKIFFILSSFVKILFILFIILCKNIIYSIILCKK